MSDLDLAAHRRAARAVVTRVLRIRSEIANRNYGSALDELDDLLELLPNDAGDYWLFEDARRAIEADPSFRARRAHAARARLVGGAEYCDRDGCPGTPGCSLCDGLCDAS